MDEPKEATPQRVLLNCKQVAERLGVKMGAVYRLARKGYLPPTVPPEANVPRVGPIVLQWDAAEIEEWAPKVQEEIQEGKRRTEQFRNGRPKDQPQVPAEPLGTVEDMTTEIFGALGGWRKACQMYAASIRKASASKKVDALYDLFKIAMSKQKAEDGDLNGVSTEKLKQMLAKYQKPDS